jgi:hypothetical protein
MKTLTELSLATGFWISRTIQWADDAALIYAVQDQDKLSSFGNRLMANRHCF